MDDLDNELQFDKIDNSVLGYNRDLEVQTFDVCLIILLLTKFFTGLELSRKFSNPNPERFNISAIILLSTFFKNFLCNFQLVKMMKSNQCRWIQVMMMNSSTKNLMKSSTKNLMIYENEIGILCQRPFNVFDPP